MCVFVSASALYGYNCVRMCVPGVHSLMRAQWHLYADGDLALFEIFFKH